MNLKETKEDFVNSLKGHYELEEIESLFVYCLQRINQLKRVDFVLNSKRINSDNQQKKWNEVIARLSKGVPVQYVFGKADFYSLEFELNSYTLIPRSETEELVEWVIDKVNQTKDFKLNPINVLDVGTGSGCIAVSLSKYLFCAQVYAMDVCREALSVAKINAIKNQVEVNFFQEDVLTLKDLSRGVGYHVIVSNPPYVREQEKDQIHSNVKDFEPARALFVDDDDPLLFYRKIALLAKKTLVEKGMLFFEINQYLADQTINLLKQIGYNHIELKKDLKGNDRMVLAQL